MENYLIIGIIGIVVILVLNGLRVWFFAKDPDHHKKFHLRHDRENEKK